jgi:hypothetical protein
VIQQQQQLKAKAFKSSKLLGSQTEIKADTHTQRERELEIYISNWKPHGIACIAGDTQESIQLKRKISRKRKRDMR